MTTATSQSDGTEGLWWIGVLMSLGASFGTVIGMTLQKIGHQRNKRLPPAKRKSCWKSPFTWMGLALIIVLPAPLDVGALAFAKYSVLAPFSGFTLVLNAIVAPQCLGESVQLVDYLGAALICFGTSITTMYGSHASRTYDVEALISIYTSPKTLAYTFVGGTFTICAVITVWLMFREQSAETEANVKGRGRGRSRGGSFAQGSASGRGGDDESVKVVEMQSLLKSSIAASECPQPSITPTAKSRKRSGSYHARRGLCRISCCFICQAMANVGGSSSVLWLAYVNGVAGSTQQVCVKTLVELLKTSTTDGKENQFAHPLTYFVGIVAGTMALVQLRILNFGLERYSQVSTRIRCVCPMTLALRIENAPLGWFSNIFALLPRTLCRYHMFRYIRQ